MLQPRNLTEDAYRRLRHAVMTGLLLPGTHLSEAMLCQRYGLTLAPVRTAMARLRAEGLLIARWRAGHLVAPITEADVLDIFATRRLLQGHAVERAAGRVDGAALRRLDASCTAAFVGREHYLNFKHAFHQMVVDMVGSPSISHMMAALLDRSMRMEGVMLRLTTALLPLPCWRPQLIAALERGEAAQARSIILQHLEDLEALALTLLAAHPGLRQAVPSRRTGRA